MTKQEYLNNLISFYKEKKESISDDYLDHKVYEKKIKIPFEMFVLVICESKYTEEVYNWFCENHIKLKKEWENHINKQNDLFEYMIEKYSVGSY